MNRDEDLSNEEMVLEHQYVEQVGKMLAHRDATLAIIPEAGLFQVAILYKDREKELLETFDDEIDALMFKRAVEVQVKG